LQTSANQALVDLANQIAQKKAEAEAQAEQQKFALAQLLAQAGIDVTKLNPSAQAQEPDYSNLDLSGLNLDFGNIGGLTL
jgi:homospermidine synthase